MSNNTQQLGLAQVWRDDLLFEHKMWYQLFVGCRPAFLSSDQKHLVKWREELEAETWRSLHPQGMSFIPFLCYLGAWHTKARYPSSRTHKDLPRQATTPNRTLTILPQTLRRIVTTSRLWSDAGHVKSPQIRSRRPHIYRATVTPRERPGWRKCSLKGLPL